MPLLVGPLVALAARLNGLKPFLGAAAAAESIPPPLLELDGTVPTIVGLALAVVAA